MATQVAWIMIGDFPGVFSSQFKTTGIDQLVDILGDKNHFEVDHKLGIFVFEAVVTMWRRDHDLLHTMIDKFLDIFLGKTLEQIFIASFADTFTAAAFLGAKDPKIDSGLIQESGRGDRHFSHPRVIA